jgi:hypothetical protein
MSRGIKSVSSAVGSNVRISSDVPFTVRFAAVKPAPVNSMNRFSASATAAWSVASNWWHVSPV